MSRYIDEYNTGVSIKRKKTALVSSISNNHNSNCLWILSGIFVAKICNVIETHGLKKSKNTEVGAMEPRSQSELSHQ